MSCKKNVFALENRLVNRSTRSVALTRNSPVISIVRLYKNMCRPPLLSILFMALLSSCSIIATKNPSIEDVEGLWESTTLGSYSAISISSENKGILVVVESEDNVKSYKLASFLPGEYEIEMKFIDLEGIEMPVVVSASVIDGSLIISDKSDQDIHFWYIGATELSKYRELAAKAIRAQEEKKQNKALQPTPKSSAPEF